MNEDIMKISIPVTQALDSYSQQIILQKQATNIAAQRFLQQNNTRPTKLLLQQTRTFIKEQYPKPKLDQRFINEEYSANISFQQRKKLSFPQEEHQNYSTKPSPARKVIGFQKSMLQQIYDIDKQPKPDLPKQLKQNVNNTKDRDQGKISGFLLQSLALDQNFDELDDNNSHSAVNYQNIGARDQIIMQQIQQKVEFSSQNKQIWCIGGLSNYEIVNRFITEQKNPILQMQKPVAPFNESRQKVVSLAKQITKDKIIISEKILSHNNYICFPVLFNDIFPNYFYQILQIFEVEEQFPINQYFKMRTLKKFKDDIQKQEIRDMAVKIKDQLIKIYQADVDQLIKQIVELNYVKFTTQSGVILKKYYDENIKKQAPTSTNSDEFVSCSMDERLSEETTILDVLRYLEGFNTTFVFKNIKPAQITSKLLSKPVSELSLIMSQIFEFFYIAPLDQQAFNQKYSLQASFNDTHSTSTAQKTISLIQTFKNANATTPFTTLTEAVEDTQYYNMETNLQLISALRQKFAEIQQLKSIEISSHISSKKFVDYLVQNNFPQSLSPQRFREVRTEFLAGQTGGKINLAKELQYVVLASIVCAVKAVEEKFAVVLSSQIGRILEGKFVVQMWGVCDELGVLRQGLMDLYK